MKSGNFGKRELRRKLFAIAIHALESEGWKVERVPGERKSSVRRITRDGKSLLVSIRTTQDQWIAFHRNEQDGEFETLSEIDAVVAVSVDDKQEPRSALVHLLDGDEMRDRFDRNYSARKAAGHPVSTGAVWVSLYEKEAHDPANRAGAGAGLKHRPIARVPLRESKPNEQPVELQRKTDDERAQATAEAKELVALAYGVDASCVRITIET